MKKKHLSRILACSLSLALVVTSVPSFAAAGNAKTTDKTENVSSGLPGYDLMKDVLKKNMQSFSNDMAYTPDDVVTFIVELEREPILDVKSENITVSDYLETAIGARALSAIEKEQKTVLSSIQKIRSADIKVLYQYTTVLNGFAVETAYSEKENLEAIPGVKSVTVAQTHDYVEPTNGYTQAATTSGVMMHSDEVNAEGYTGKGTVTAILDTGLDITHEAFANAPEEPYLDKDDIAAFVEGGDLNASVSADDLYKSAKIPFAYDYADQDADVAGSNDHGTHVAGTVGADCDGFSGVAPDTQLVIMKVFSDQSAGASDASIFAALEDAVVLGVDTINMSLGSASGFTSVDSEDVTDAVYNRVEEAGINLMCAAGNDYNSTYGNLLGTDLALVENPDSGIVGSPSTYHAAVSVASVNESYSRIVYFMAGGRKILFTDTAEAEDKQWSSLNGQSYEYVLVPGYGDAYDFASVEAEGKIAVVKRGSLAFTEKEQNAYDAGAVGCIVYDNVDGDLINMQTNGLLPMIFISKEDGKYLRSLSEKVVTMSDDYESNEVLPSSGLMSDFSSLGVAPDLTLKPEITAPGGDVYSTLPGGKYGNMSGTSMACPHMAGAASVVRQYVNETFSDLSAAEKQDMVNNLILSTAVPVADEYGVAYSPRKQGAGLANVFNAVHTEAYLSVEGNDRPQAELKDSTDGTYAFSFTIHNLTDKELAYDMAAIPLTAKEEKVNGYNCISENSRVMGADELEVTFSQNTVVVPANGTADVTVSIVLTDGGKSLLKNFVNGTFLDGFITVAAADEDGIDLSLPYLAFYGDWGQVPVFDSTVYDDSAAFMYDGSLALLNSDYYGYFMGTNLFLDEADADYDADKNAFNRSYAAAGYTVCSILGLLRAPKVMQYTVEDADGNLVYGIEAGEIMKTFYYASGGFIAYDLLPPSYGFWPLYNGGDGYYYWMPEGDYVFKFNALVDGTDTVQTLSIPFSFDTTKPSIVSTDYEEEDGVPYLYVTVTDNNYVMGLQLISDDGSRALSDIYVVDEDKKGAETTVKIDLSYAQQSGDAIGRIVVNDYALNELESDQISLVSDEIEVQEVRINETSITAVVGSSDMTLHANVKPESAVDKTVTWSTSNENVVSIVKDNGDGSCVIAFVGAGTAEVFATASNGVTGSTGIILVSDPNPVLTDDWDGIISKDGVYKLPANFSKTISIQDDARDVYIIGNAANTAENPYTNNIVSSVSDLNLTIQDLNMSVKYTAGIAFAGTGNTLTLAGTNTFNITSSGAGIYVPKDASLTVNGKGTLNLNLALYSSGAGIGGNAGTGYSSDNYIAGSITIDSGIYNIESRGSGAGIGGAGYGISKKITVNGGAFNIALKSEGWSNKSTCGAGIGTGVSPGMQTGPFGDAQEIEINGGVFNGSTELSAAIIGGGNRNSYATIIITINGGYFDLESIVLDSDASGLPGGACIGLGGESLTSSYYGKTLKINIYGGNIVAKTSSYAAAIGGGVASNGGTINIYGGTVTASNASPESDVVAIGKGGYYSSGSAAVLIDGGSVKAKEETESVSLETAEESSITGWDSIQNDDMDDVYEVLLYAPGVTGLNIDGKDYKVSANHPDDDYVHPWVPEGEHEVTVKTAGGDITYNLIVYNDGTYELYEKYTVTYDLTDIEVSEDAPVSVKGGETLEAVLTAAGGKILPDTIKVTVGGVVLAEDAYTWDSETGIVAIPNVNGNVVITAAAVVDKSELYDLIMEATGLNEDDYTLSSWSDLQQILAIAKLVYEDPAATVEDVAEAAESLRIYIDALVERGDNTTLLDLIAEVEELDEQDYTTDSWAALMEELEAAKAVAEDGDAVQEDMDAAYDALNAAAKALVLRGDKTALEELIAAAEALDEGDYTSETWAALEEALEAAKAVDADMDALQETIDAAYAALESARDALVKLGDKSELEATIAAAEALDEEVYTSETWAALEEALEAAKAVDADPEALQDAVDAADVALKAAIDALKKAPVDKSALQDEVDRDEAINTEDYTVESSAELAEALKEANGVLDDPDATQKEVDEALEALKAAREALEEAGNPDKAKELVEKAKEELDQYTEESAETIEKAIEEVEKAVSGRATQEELDAVTEKLQAALDNGVKKAIERPGDGEDNKPDDNKPDDNKPDDNKPDDNNQKDNPPSTGDVSPVVPWFLVVLVSGCAVFALRRKKAEK